MTYELYIGDRSFSSWSLRGWLMLQAFDIPRTTHMTGLYAGTLQEDLAELAPARTVPAIRTPEGHVLTDSIAMAETLVERHPEIALLPRDPAARALARCLIAEMHSGFMALRGDCPNNLRTVWEGFEPSEAVLDDVERIETLWSLARARHSDGGPWLFGTYSLADVFYSPVACRITTYGLPMSDLAQEYVALHLTEPNFLDWRKEALTETYDPEPYNLGLPQATWPVNAS